MERPTKSSRGLGLDVGPKLHGAGDLALEKQGAHLDGAVRQRPALVLQIEQDRLHAGHVAELADDTVEQALVVDAGLGAEELHEHVALSLEQGSLIEDVDIGGGIDLLEIGDEAAVGRRVDALLGEGRRIDRRGVDVEPRGAAIAEEDRRARGDAGRVARVGGGGERGEEDQEGRGDGGGTSHVDTHRMPGATRAMAMVCPEAPLSLPFHLFRARGAAGRTGDMGESFEARGEIGILWVDNPPVNAISQRVRQGMLDGVRQAAADGAITGVDHRVSRADVHVRGGHHRVRKPGRSRPTCSR